MLEKISNGYKLFCAYLFGTSVTLLLLIIVLRGAFHISYDFMTDAVVWSTVWAALLLIGPLYTEKGGHVAVGTLLEMLSSKTRLICDTFNALGTLLFTGLEIYAGIALVHFLYVGKAFFPRNIPIPMWPVKLCVVIGFAIFFIYALGKLYQCIRKMRGQLAKGKIL